MHGTNHNLNMEPEGGEASTNAYLIHGMGVQPECPKDQ